MTDVIARCVELAKTQPQRLVLPEGNDPRVQQAACQMRDQGIADPILIGDRKLITQNSDIRDIRILEPAELLARKELAQTLIGKRKKIREHNVDQYLSLPIYQGVAMIHEDLADAMVAGAVLPTAKVMEAAFAIGAREGIKTLSSFFLMELPNPADGVSKTLFFADCALNIDPSAEQLADIAIVSAASAAKLLGCTPKVAMLSFSTHGSARHPTVRKVANAVAMVRERAPEIEIEGELQVDAALSPRVATTKVKSTSNVAGQANVLIFPDLNAGNIAYKIVQYCGGAQATGPILQGFAKPVCDLSRGATVDDIISAAAVTIALASEPVNKLAPKLP